MVLNEHLDSLDMRTNYVHITQQIDDSIQMSHRSHIYLMGLQLKLYI